MSVKSSDHVVFVSGAAQGIGRATTEGFLAIGSTVMAFDVDESVLELQAISDRLIAVVGDVSSATDVETAVEQLLVSHGRLDAMVANAGMGGGAPVAELADDQLRRILDVNLIGVFNCCRAAARVMSEQRSGSIVTIGSIFGQDAPARTAAYSASKAGVAAMTVALSRELGPFGVTVNCVSPGHIETRLYEGALKRRAAVRGMSLEEIRRRELEPIALNRFGTPEDVADVVLFLTSPAARYVTGQRINVDGGIQPR